MQGFEQRTRAWSRAATTNPETLLQLLSSFFEFYADVLESWRHDLGYVLAATQPLRFNLDQMISRFAFKLIPCISHPTPSPMLCE